MAPLQALRFLEEGPLAKDSEGGGDTAGPAAVGAFVGASEPYIIGGHTASGYYVGPSRETTIPGLFAAGDAAGGAPQKYVSGAMAEGAMAAAGVLERLKAAGGQSPRADQRVLERALAHAEGFLAEGSAPYSADELESAMQASMDLYAGGGSASYRYSTMGLKEAKKELGRIWPLARRLRAGSAKELSRVYELKERLLVSWSLITHLLNRKETRWPGFGEYFDYPDLDPRYELFLNSRPPEPDGCWPEGPLENTLLLARGLDSAAELPLPEPQEDPPGGGF
jgi:adenylylsulfate reductase subunit A